MVSNTTPATPTEKINKQRQGCAAVGTARAQISSALLAEAFMSNQHLHLRRVAGVADTGTRLDM